MKLALKLGDGQRLNFEERDRKRLGFPKLLMVILMLTALNEDSEKR